MADSIDQSRWGEDLDRCAALMRRLHAQAGLRSRSLGVPEWDWDLWRIGREWLAVHKDAVRASLAPEPSLAVHHRHDVYLATQVYEIGGHTPLIGDFVRALDPRWSHGSSADGFSHLILTDIHGARPSLPDAILSRLGLSAASVTVLQGPSLLDRLHQLLTQLLSLKPQRLFLFHHPEDPLPSAVAHAEIARQCTLIHHADSTPSFGMHLPGVRIVDLNPHAAAMTRFLGRVPAFLPLTAPDPGPRPHRFLTRERLITASSGSAHKFASPYALSYADTVGVILRSTGGWHVHIGPLLGTTLGEINSVFQRERLPVDRFVHVPWTPSVASTLWEQGVDVYFASFPIDGARTKVEVLASATPYLRHSSRPDIDRQQADPSRDHDGGLMWRSWSDLTMTLQRLSSAAALEEESALMRQVYDTRHHQQVFARTLARILEGGDGVDDRQHRERDGWAVQAMVRSLTASILHGTDAAASAESALQALSHVEERLATQQRGIDDLLEERSRLQGELGARLAAQQQRIDVLQEERSLLEQQVNQLRAERDRWLGGGGLKARFRQWLMRP